MLAHPHTAISPISGNTEVWAQEAATRASKATTMGSNSKGKLALTVCVLHSHDNEALGCVKKAHTGVLGKCTQGVCKESVHTGSVFGKRTYRSERAMEGVSIACHD